GFPVGRPLPSSTPLASVSHTSAGTLRSRHARTLLPRVWVWFAVQTPPGQSSIQPFGLAIASVAACMLTIIGAITAAWVPLPGVTVEGAIGAGLSAGVTPSACTYTRKRASWAEA